MVRFAGRWIGACVTAAVALGAALPARAQGAGFQAGVSIDPEQVYVGTHFESPSILNQFHFRPGIEGGFGEGFGLATVNFEFVYVFQIPGSAWRLHQGGGPAINVARFDGENDVSAGFTGVFGFGHVNGFFAEVRLGSGTSPALKFGAGYTLRW